MKRSIAISPVSSGLLWVLAMTVVIEAVTCLFRFGFRLEMTRNTSWISALTFGIRIHHGYFGVILCLASMTLMRSSPLGRFGLRLGAALILSDLVHHYAILWPIVGSPQFDLTYPI